MGEYSFLIMYSRELKRDVKVYILLPNSYYESDKFYPVLYMHDGQNLFYDSIAYRRKCWGIIESYEKYPDLPELIIVGIASCETRNDELLPVAVDLEQDGKIVGGKAKNYMNFIVNKLKPMINNKYRVLKSAKYTGIMGASFGGVCSVFAAVKYSEHFTRFGCVSSAFFPIQKGMLELINESDFSKVKKMYLDVGTNESENEEYRMAYIESNEEVVEILKTKLDSESLKFRIIKDAQHIETDWEKRFPEIIKYLFN